jgi:myo-inositol 2-dehydrogenase/D-chiro-inositol 1-dehydrogenase
LATICLHPPGPDSEAYYQVSLSREETGAVIVPDLPLRLHPAISLVQGILTEGTLGKFQCLHLEIPVRNPDEDPIRETFPQVVDLARAIGGEVEAVWAIAPPKGERSRTDLNVYLDMVGGSQSQVGIWHHPSDPQKLTVCCSSGTMIFEYDPDFSQPSRFELRPANSNKEVREFDAWDSHDAIYQVLLQSLDTRQVPAKELPSPNLDDGIRAMELTEAIVRSLRRERKVDLHPQPISEEANFKSVMTSTGCLILIGILFILPLALSGNALGIPGLAYLSYLIPLMLGIFLVLQVLRFAVRNPNTNSEDETKARENP